MPQVVVRLGCNEGLIFKTEKLNQTTVVQNTYYTVLDIEGNDILLYSISTRQTNDETDAKDIEVEVTIDAEAVSDSGGISQANSSIYYTYMQGYESGADALYSTTTINSYGITKTAIRCRYLKVRIRCTSAVGTNQALIGYVNYSEN